MGRKPLNPTGPMTAAERQARRRKRVGKTINRQARRPYKLAKEPGREATQQRLDEWNAVQSIGKDGHDYRVGDCRVMLADIRDNSIPLILTDPPYGINPEPLYRWLAELAGRALIPGGSLICYTGLTTVERDRAIFREQPRLTFWTEAVLVHDRRQKLHGLGVYANHKPVLWFVKDGFRRKAANGKLTKVPSVVHAKGDKTTHPWAQGDGGVQQWIYHLTEKGETIVDPFAGPVRWGRIANERGRRWIGCDIEKGGSTRVKV